MQGAWGWSLIRIITVLLLEIICAMFYIDIDVMFWKIIFNIYSDLPGSSDGVSASSSETDTHTDTETETESSKTETETDT